MPTEKIDEVESWAVVPCQSRDHNPSAMRVFQPGRYRHTCSECGQVYEFVVHPNTRMMFLEEKING